MSFYIDVKISSRCFYRTKFFNFTENFPELTCKSRASTDLCTLYHINEANCINENYQKLECPKWKCYFGYLNSKVLVKDYDLDCNHVTSKSDDLQRYFEKNSCSLTYWLDQNKTNYYDIELFRNTPYLLFDSSEQTTGICD